jgi:Na+-transporting methylmalonyl-CoA/oxaloacetate decarboxylase gamma subunit
MEIVLVLAVLAVVVWLIAGPLRRRQPEPNPAEPAARAELEAAKEAKFREIRDAELDYRTGKLSREDWRGIDASLRAEAVEVLRRIDALDSAD